jgi:hypothetical protein
MRAVLGAMNRRVEANHGLLYDELWNATRKEMLLTDNFHAYYRMYWKK